MSTWSGANSIQTHTIHFVFSGDWDQEYATGLNAIEIRVTYTTFVNVTPTPSTRTAALTLNAPTSTFPVNQPAPTTVSGTLTVNAPVASVDEFNPVLTLPLSLSTIRPVIKGVAIDLMEYATTEEAQAAYVSSGGVS